MSDNKSSSEQVVFEKGRSGRLYNGGKCPQCEEPKPALQCEDYDDDNGDAKRRETCLECGYQVFSN